MPLGSKFHDGSESCTGWIPVRGDSMWPSLRSGDLAGFAPLEGAPRAGEVIIARLPHGLIVHRVVSTSADSVWMRGDNCASADSAIPLQAVLGVVRCVRRGARALERSEWATPPGPGRRIQLKVQRWVRRAIEERA